MATLFTARGLVFDGTTNYIDCGKFLTPSYTKEAWFIVDESAPQNNNIISGAGRHAFRVKPGNGHKVSAGHSSNWDIVMDPTRIGGGWQHYAVTYDAATTTMELFRNGQSVDKNNSVESMTDTAVQIGAWSGGFHFGGTIGEVRIWDHVRTPDQIRDNRFLELNGNESGLLAYYKFAENADSMTLSDASGNGHTGALKNFSTPPGWKPELTTTAIPTLSGSTGVHLTLGPTNHDQYFTADQTLKAVMVFVDFPDTKVQRGTTAILDAATVGGNIVGPNDEAATLFSEQSNNKFTLTVDVKSDIGWIDVAQNTSAYLDTHKYIDYAKLKTDIIGALTALATADTDATSPAESQYSVDFDAYDMTFVVLAKEAAALNPDSWLRYSPSYTSDDAIIFGGDSYLTFYSHMVHEVGHQIGLPDLYPSSSVGDVLTEEHKTAGVQHGTGCWSNMACMLHSLSFLGWERHKLGWLDASRELFLEELPEEPQMLTLTALTQDSGVSMIVLPIDSTDSPSRVLVIEVAQDSYGIVKENGKSVLKKDGDGNVLKNPNTGVLLYTVDATVRSGHLPIIVIPKTVSTSTEYQDLYEAPFSAGDSRVYTDGTFSAKVEILGNVGDDYTIAVSKAPAATESA